MPNFTPNLYPPIPAEKILDARSVPCSRKHGLILQRWHDLPVNDFFVLVNGHDPLPLRDQFAADFPGAFRWEQLQAAAGNVRIKITKLKPVAADPTREWTCPDNDDH